MALAHAMWTHGHEMQIEYPDRLNWVQRTGCSTRVQARGAAQPNWFHFAIPTPVIVNDNRLRVGSVLIRFRSAGGAFIKAIHVYDGETKIASKDNLNLGPIQWHVERVEVPNHPNIQWGLGISVSVDFGPDDREIEFSSAGCDFLTVGVKIQPTAEPCANVRDFGAKADGRDDTLAIQNTLDANPCVIVPPGEYRIDGTLKVSSSLFLLPGATLIRKSQYSPSTDPVVLIRGPLAALLGSGWVRTENNSPRGVVCVGPDLTLGSSNLNWTRIDGIKISGVSTDTLNVGLNLDSSEPPPPLGVGSGSNYNGNFSNILIREVGVGVKIGPLCNAHTFSNLFFYQLTKYSYWSKGNSSNTFFGGFTHQSPLVAVIKLEGAGYNLFYGVQAEPGSGSYFVVDKSSINCQILGHDNCPNTSINESDTFTYLGAGYLSLVSLEATAHLPRFGAPYKVVPLQGKEQPESVAASVAELKNDFNTLLQNLRESGVIK